MIHSEEIHRRIREIWRDKGEPGNFDDFYDTWAEATSLDIECEKETPVCSFML